MLDTRERVEGKTDRLSALRQLTWGAGGRWLTSTETGDWGILTNIIRKQNGITHLRGTETGFFRLR